MVDEEAREESAAEAEAEAGGDTAGETGVEPSFTYEELSGKTVAELREIAAGIEHDAVRGYSTMHKEHLLPAICEALGVEAHVHHEVVGIDKAEIKARIRELKARRDAILDADDLDRRARKAELKEIRRGIHRLKRELRRAMV